MLSAVYDSSEIVFDRKSSTNGLVGSAGRYQACLQSSLLVEPHLDNSSAEKALYQQARQKHQPKHHRTPQSLQLTWLAFEYLEHDELVRNKTEFSLRTIERMLSLVSDR